MKKKDYGWVQDPNVNIKKLGERAPEGHIRRCQSRNRFLLQCGRWALKGSDRCLFHTRAHNRKYYNKRNEDQMTRIYSKRASANLTDLLNAAKEGAPEDRLSLVEEIDVARAVAERSIKLFDVSCCSETADKVSPEVKQLAMKNAMDALTNVASLIAQHARITEIAKNTFTAEQIDYYIEGVKRALHDALLPDHTALYDSIISNLSKLKIPEKDTKTVSITIA